MHKTAALKNPVLVTGALGFIGRRLVNRLLEEKYEVVAFDLPEQSIPAEWEGKARYVAGDIANIQDVSTVAADAGTIFHLAAIVGDWGAEDLHHRVTVDGTELLLEQARIYNCRVLMTTSIVVYGDKIDKGICHESLELGKTFGPYSRSKQAQEMLAEQYIKKGLRLTVIRPANVYGAGSKPWVNDLSKVLRSGAPTLIGGGNFNAGLVHVENVVELMLLAATNNIAIGEIYNICDEESVTWKEYTTAIASFIGVSKPKSIPKWLARIIASLYENLWRLFNRQSRPPLTHESLNLVGSHHQITIEKAKTQLGYRPVINYQQGLVEISKYINRSTSY